MERVHTISRVREHVRPARAAGRSVGLVPTMGALHEGHLSLIRAARKAMNYVVVSVFVNPAQFGPGEDLAAYPRTLDADCDAADRAGADVVFAPSAAEMYGEGYATYVIQENLTEVLCGASRPGHFHGVCTVVLKLLNIVQPDVAFFGRKDFQQTVVIRRMLADLNVPVALRVLPTVRDTDGLALSSRNKHLSACERRDALCLYRALTAARDRVAKGERKADALRAAMAEIIAQVPTARPDYVAVVDPDTLESLDRLTGPAVAALAVRIGDTRLIDNMPLDPPEKDPPTP